MIGQCKFCCVKNDVHCCYFICEENDFGCIDFKPQETLLESEIVEWMLFAKHQQCKTAEAVVKGKRKYIKHDDNCIQIEKDN
jgi:hypothetical protein